MAPTTPQTILITGATSGIGRAAAESLAAQGHRLLIAARNPEKGRGTVAAIRQKTGNASADFLLADLSSMAEVRRLAGEVVARTDRLDVLVNNAAGVFARRQENADGFELTFATNHLSCFLLTNLLLDVLKASRPSRVVNVSSAAHHNRRLDLDDLQMTRDYQIMEAYGRSKLANLYFTYELARRLAGSGVTANALHPGWIASGLGANNFGVLGRLIKGLINLSAAKPEQGARTVVYLATSEEVAGVSGQYFVDEKPVRSSAISYDEAIARRLWEISAELVGL